MADRRGLAFELPALLACEDAREEIQRLDANLLAQRETVGIHATLPFACPRAQYHGLLW